MSGAEVATVELYPPTDPHASGLLPVGDGNAIYWEVAGAPDGKPAVVLHGGPGQGSSPNMRRAFDPAKYRVVLFDQRGCGRSTPHASDPATDMRFNTTAHLVADMEVLRAHLGIDRWLVSGGSWGAALAVAYAAKHTDRVSEVVLSNVMLARRSEVKWLYEDLATIFPEAAERFHGRVADDVNAGGGVVAAYARRLSSADATVRLEAARAWCEWEDAVLSLEPSPSAGMLSGMGAEETVAFARICAHYFSHGAWLEEGELMDAVRRFGEVPAVILHGRRDLSCPVETAWQLARAWPGARLEVFEDAGHLGSMSKRRALMDALDGFAARR